MKIVVCPDSFKGSLNAMEVAATISESLQNIYPYAKIIQVPLADGGEGTAEIITQHGYPNQINIKSHDPLGKLISVNVYMDESGKKAFIESAQIIGLPLLTFEERNPLITSSFGLGEVIKKTIDRGCEEITVSLGGSATCDGGKGMLEILDEINTTGVKFNIVCDVTNPLLGENGAVKVFAPQKGASAEDLPVLEKRLQNLVEKAKKAGVCNDEDISKEGAGAAGGLGFAFQTYLKAQNIKGIDYVLETIGFQDKIKGSDLIITGEGKIDKQSLMGKVLSGVLNYSKRDNIPLIAVGGIVENEGELLKAGLKGVYSIADSKLSLEENMTIDNTKKNLRKTIEFMSKSNIFQQIMS